MRCGSPKMLRHSEASDYIVSVILPVEELNVSTKLSIKAWHLKPPPVTYWISSFSQSAMSIKSRLLDNR